MFVRRGVAVATLATVAALLATGAESSAPSSFRILIVTSMDQPPHRSVATALRPGGSVQSSALAPEVASARFSPEGRRVVYGTGFNAGSKRIYVASVGAGRGRLLATARRCIRAFCPTTSQAWSPDGKKVVLSVWDRLPRLFVVTLRTGRRKEITPRTATLHDEYHELLWSPGGKSLGVLRRYGQRDTNRCCKQEYHLMRPDGTARRWVYRHRGDTFYDSLSFSWAPDNRRLALAVQARGTSFAAVVDIRTRRTRWLPRTGSTARIVWSPDSQTIALTQFGNGIQLVDASGQRRSRRLLPGTSVTSIAFAPDGKSLVAALARRSSRGELRLVPLDAGPSRVVFRSPRGWSIRHVETRP